MSGNGKLLTPQAVQPQMVISQPFNDVQLVALMAAHRQDCTPEEAVEWAYEAFARAVAKAPTLGKRLRAAQSQEASHAD